MPSMYALTPLLYFVDIHLDIHFMLFIVLQKVLFKVAHWLIGIILKLLINYY